MAATIVTTPSLGASDWSSFITQVEYMRRGFMAVSYTNFAASAASAIASGSMIEIAGSLYQFTETAIDYTGGGSSSSDLYIYCMPSAGGTTCTVVAWGSAPTWVDAKQGFYASAASITRAIGGMYVAVTAQYMHKFLYTPEHVRDCLTRNTTRPLLRGIANIGEWNMDETTSLSVVITDTVLLRSRVRRATAYIVSDDNSDNKPLNTINTLSSGSVLVGFAAGGITDTSLVAFELYRLTGGIFDNAIYNGTASTVPSRGYVVYEFEA